MVPILVRYWLQLQNSGCRTTLVPLSLAGTRTVRKLIAFVSAYVLKSHGQVATVVAKYEHLDVVDQNNAERILPLHQHQLDYQRQRGLTACHWIFVMCVYFKVTWSRLFSAVHCMLFTLKARFTILTNHNTETNQIVTCISKTNRPKSHDTWHFRFF
jgi:hypothetical protein